MGAGTGKLDVKLRAVVLGGVVSEWFSVDICDLSPENVH